MRNGLFLAIAALSGCIGWNPPELDLVDEVPIVATGQKCADQRTAWVACTLDGDTFDAEACGEENGFRYRMLGINAPEIAHEGNPAECFGNEAAAELANLIEGYTVYLTFDLECSDIYGRGLAYVWLPVDGFDPELEDEDFDVEDTGALLVNVWMVEQGFARVFDEFAADLRYVQDLEQAETKARSQNIGLWGACE